MINYHTELVKALKTTGLEVYYEMFLHSGIKTPCISYMEINNSAGLEGDTIGYSNVSYQVKVWAKKLDTIQKYASEVDKIMRGLGWKRSGCVELSDPNSSMMQKIMTYDAIAHESF